MENTANETVEEINRVQMHSSKKPANWKIITGISIGIILVLLLAGISYYQATRFNSQIKINNLNVGGLTAEQALGKLESSSLKNQIYVGNKLIYDGKDTSAGLTNQDLSNIKKLLKSQWTFFPSSKAKDYSLIPNQADQNHIKIMKQEIEKQLITMNKSLTAPKDAAALLVNGKITISKSINGKQYDVNQLLQQYQNQEYNSVIHLKPVYILPVKENSPIIKQEETTLQALLQRTINYTVQNKTYALKASDLIKNASVSKNMQITMDPVNIKNTITQINNTQSTLNKNFTFKTHSGAVIQVKGQGYGWAINVGKETQQIQEAFAKGVTSLSATNLYGNGWGNKPIGYQTTTNNGIGDTYAEVSIAEQRIWIYKNGKLAVTTNVVTGRHDVHEDTHPGVWYVLYKQTPSILKGSEYGQANYSVKVQWWAPFTNDGQGFHDASWRKNWASNAYLHAGSGGCVNTPPSVMKTVYENLSTYEPVVIY